MSTGILLLDQGTAGIAKLHGLSLNTTHWTQFCQTLEQQQAILGLQLSFGRIRKLGQNPAWCIAHSTVPGCVDKALLPSSITVEDLDRSIALEMGILCPQGGWKLLPA